MTKKIRENIAFILPVLLVGLLLIRLPEKSTLTWQDYSPEAFEEQLIKNGELLLYFHAEWCEPCHQMDRTTFRDPETLAVLERIPRMHIDLTEAGTPKSDALIEQFGLDGVPTMIFYHLHDGEMLSRRTYGYIGPRYMREFIGEAFESEENEA